MAEVSEIVAGNFWGELRRPGANGKVLFMTLPFFTIGHSNQNVEAFVGLLKEYDVELVVDVRTVPRSRSNPQFNKDTLPATLDAVGLHYEHLAALGGLRKKSQDLSADANAYWTNDSFHNYADYALSQPFQAALDSLIAEGRKNRSVIMCAEAVWWRCHRRIVSDYLLARGETVFHIMWPDRIEQAQLTSGADIITPSRILYPHSK